MKKRESTVERVANLTGRLNIGAEEARVRLEPDSVDESELITRAAKLSAKGDGLQIDVRKESVTDASGTITGIDVICRQKAS